MDEPLLDDAARLAEQHVLHAYDAVHLASVLVVSESDEASFCCFDDELRHAAAAEGLRLLPAEVPDA